MENHNYCLILAGGSGSRLWPISLVSHPKQFMDLMGKGKTMIQETFDRVSQFIPHDHIFISTNLDYLPLVYEQLPQVDDTHILEEPIRRGTLSSVAWGTVVIAKKDPKAQIMVTPCDHMIQDESVYQQDMHTAFQFISTHEGMLVTGVRPSRPETGYGYIQMDETNSLGKDIFRVMSFTEKPNADFAKMFIEEGNFLWNAGIFFYKVDVMLSNLYRLVPEYQVEIPRMMAEAETADPKLVPEFFSSLPNLNVDVSVLERCENTYVLSGHFGWADVGTWANLYNDAPADGQGNVLMNTKGYLYDCKDNLVRLPQGRIAVLKGLEGYVVAEEDGILMICPREDVAAMRKKHIYTEFSDKK